MLIVDVALQTHHGGFAHRWVTLQHILDLSGEYKAPPDLDDFLDAVAHIDFTVRVVVAKIAAVYPVWKVQANGIHIDASSATLLINKWR